MADCIGTDCKREGLQAEITSLGAAHTDLWKRHSRQLERESEWIKENDALRARVAELEAARVNDAKVYSVPVEAAALLADLRDELERVRLAYMEDARAMRQRNGELREVLHGLISVRFNEDAAEVEAAYDAAKEELRARVAALESAALAVLGCNDRCCIQSPQCWAQCQADEKLRAVLSAGAVHE